MNKQNCCKIDAPHALTAHTDTQLALTSSSRFVCGEPDLVIVSVPSLVVRGDLWGAYSSV